MGALPALASPITIPLSTLQTQSTTNPIPNKTLLSAFGPSSLGILLVSNLPPRFATLRSRVLTSISHLSHLSPSALSSLENPTSKYLVGWSHGKETLRPGVVDTAKGSYYVNCAFDENDITLQRMRDEYAGFDEYTAANVWPSEADVPGFQTDVEELVGMIVDVAGLVARAVDGFAAENVDSYPVGRDEAGNGYLEGVVRRSRTSKARLLHYFPSNEVSKNGDEDLGDSWCATHLDHSCLTGLTSAAFYNESVDAYTELSASPSPSAGLYILDRDQRVHKVAIPRDCLAFQTGEALELITQGKLKAVPHFVRGVEAGEVDGKVSRNTLAVFTQPNLRDVVELDTGLTFGEFARRTVGRNTTG